MMTRLLVGLGVLGTALVLAGCGPEYPNCDDDEDCRPGEFCVNNLCVKCRNDADCPTGQECRDGACRDIPGYCDATRRCPMGQVCRDNRCSPCISDEECGPGMVCLDGVCQAPPECDPTRPCPAGQECISGRCRPIPPPPECQFTSIYFDYNKDTVRRDQRETAQTNRTCMAEHNRPVRLTGYCDERGSEEYNMALGERRATAVRRYMINLGVASSNIAGTSSRGKTESRRCYDEACWQQDRRVDFRD